MNFSDYFLNSKFEHDGLKLLGISSAGIGTCFFLPEMSLAIDVAQGLPFAQSAKNFLITHAHMDHSAGIPYLISQRAISNMTPPIFYMPAKMVEPMKKVMQAWSAVDGHDYQFSFQPVEAGEMYSLSKDHSFKPFQTFHRVPSVGYTIYENRKKLKPQYEGLDKQGILALKEKGFEPSEVLHEPIFSYTGDTKIEFWKANPEVLKSKILFVEVTYWDHKKSVEDAREWGHIHLDELLPLLDQFEGEKLVLTHISSRYSKDYALKLLHQKTPKHLHPKLAIF